MYVRIDDELTASPQHRWRPRVGIAPKTTDAELVHGAVMQRATTVAARSLPRPGRPAGLGPTRPPGVEVGQQRAAPPLDARPGSRAP
jgi:hypothetical protein